MSCGSPEQIQSGCIQVLKGHGFSRAVTQLKYMSPLGAEGTTPSTAEAGLYATASARLKACPFKAGTGTMELL